MEYLKLEKELENALEALIDVYAQKRVLTAAQFIGILQLQINKITKLGK